MFPVLPRLLVLQSIAIHISYFQKYKFNEKIYMTREMCISWKTMKTVWKFIENSRLQGSLLLFYTWPGTLRATESPYQLCYPLLCMSPFTSFICSTHTFVIFTTPRASLLCNFLALTPTANWVNLSAFPGLRFLDSD